MPVHFRRLITPQIKVWARMKDVWNSSVFLCLKWYISVVQITEPKCEVLVYYFQQDWYLNAVRYEVRHPPPSSLPAHKILALRGWWWYQIFSNGLVGLFSSNALARMGCFPADSWSVFTVIGVPVARDIIVITKCGAHNGICHQAGW